MAMHPAHTASLMEEITMSVVYPRLFPALFLALVTYKACLLISL
jgi:hypothetical protein